MNTKLNLKQFTFFINLLILNFIFFSNAYAQNCPNVVPATGSGVSDSLEVRIVMPEGLALKRVSIYVEPIDIRIYSTHLEGGIDSLMHAYYIQTQLNL